MNYLSDRVTSSSSLVKNRIKLLSFNMQVGIGASKPHHYITHSWKHVFPHANHFHNLDEIARLIAGYDIVGLQEADAGSLRSSFVSQPKYLAARAGFPYFHVQTNRNLGHIARHSNSILSQFSAAEVSGHRLPGRLPGRGALVARYGDEANSLVVVLLHLALSQKARMKQLQYVADFVSRHEHVVVMGDMNCQAHSEEMKHLMQRTGLRTPTGDLRTFPSWRPAREIDHFLLSPSLHVKSVKALPFGMSDHLPVSVEISIPGNISLVA